MNDEGGMMNDESGAMDARGDSGDSSFITLRGHSSFIVAFAGGVGGAKLAYGLYRVLGQRLAVVVNTGDDFEHWGLTVCPDLDTVMYNLAGINNPEFGWGLAGETQRALEMVRRYGGESWFGLGRELVWPGRRRPGHPPAAHGAAALRLKFDPGHFCAKIGAWSDG